MKKNAYNGVATYLQHRYEVETDKPRVLSVNDVNRVMSNFLGSYNQIPSSDPIENAKTIQTAFGVFVKWCNKNLKRK